MLERGARGRSARRVFLVLGAVYALVLASPELAIGTVVRPLPPTQGPCDAHFHAWCDVTDTTPSVLRSPRDRRAAARMERPTRQDINLTLSRPPDPLTRLVHAHVAQYGGDLDLLTATEPEGAADAAEPQK